MPEIIEVWSLDGVILDIDLLFASVITRLKSLSRKPVQWLMDSLERVSQHNFTFAAWFADLRIQPAHWEHYEVVLRSMMAEHAQRCLFPGIQDILQDRQQVARQVLVVTGDEAYECWKFGLLGLDDIFKPENRHFIPTLASQVAIVAKYALMGKVTFIDSRVSSLLEIGESCPGVRRLRPAWIGASDRRRHEFDDEEWVTVSSTSELAQILGRN